MSKVFTAKEIAKHHEIGNLWVVVKGDVIDLSQYEHPGGMEILQDFYGGAKDAYEEFEENDHTAQASRIM